MAYIQEIDDEWSGKELETLTVNMGGTASTVEEFLQSHNLSLPVVLDVGGSVAQEYHVVVVPITFFIDKDGIIQGKKLGAFFSKAELEEYLSKIISWGTGRTRRVAIDIDKFFEG